MTPRTFKRAAARQDLIDHHVYLAGVAGEAVAERFLVRAEGSFADLTAQPEMGAPLALRRPELVGLRKWRDRDFEDVLIFYRPRPDGVSIVRVLHGAMGWWRLLGLVQVRRSDAAPDSVRGGCERIPSALTRQDFHRRVPLRPSRRRLKRRDTSVIERGAFPVHWPAAAESLKTNF